MAQLREPNTTAVAQYGIPYRGTWNSLGVSAIPTDALYISNNIFLRRGKLRNRPGLTSLNDTLFNGPVMGAAMVVTPSDKRVIALTPTTLYELGPGDSSWTATGSYPPSSRPVDIALLETSSLYIAIIAREGMPLLQWDGNTHVTTPVLAQATIVTDPAIFDGARPADPFDSVVFDSIDIYGTGQIFAPQAKSVCIAGRRVVYLQAPHTVGWSQVFNHINYPINAKTRLAQSGDVGICVRSLGTLSFAVYKERSIYTARAQSGLDETAFSFSEPIYVEGPAGVHAVVITPLGHIYMTKNGRVFLFDGSRSVTPISDGLWLYLQDDIDPSHAYLIFGVLDYRLNTVTFYYPKRGDAGNLRGMVIINLPYAGMDIQGQGIAIPASFLGYGAIPCTMGCEMRFNDSIDRSILFSTGSFIFDEDGNTDNSQYFDCSFQTPLVAMPNAVQHQVTVETFLERAIGNGNVKIEAVTSDGLENEAGTILDGNEQYLDLEHNPVQEHKGFNIPTRFFGVKYSWVSSNTVRYSGAVVHGRQVGR